jgi:hypothetical protein
MRKPKLFLPKVTLTEHWWAAGRAIRSYQIAAKIAAMKISSVSLQLVM